ncbi:unnamed protein product [Linum tenue]|uniref:SBP-type domain-containing protein n=1 Tax=Linum tenue TaxID=586396 RepID=A0AAV0S5S7_9ROSI|nr:unnamed protein product [Linum tenue]
MRHIEKNNTFSSQSVPTTSLVMEWNLKAASDWDWDNIIGFSSKACGTQKQVKHFLTHDDAEEGLGGMNSGYLYSPGCGGGFSGSDSGHGSSSKSSVEGLPDRISRNHLSIVGNVESVSPVDASAGSGEHVIGLKLGKRTYFEDVCTPGNTKSSSSSSSVIASSSVAAPKRTRASCQSLQSPCCQVEGCNLDLKSAKDYHRRHRICESHSKSPKVIVAGLERRFCQQCSRFHELSEFDEKKRSCRRRLSDHNARRRRPPPEALQFGSTLSTTIYDNRRQMNAMLNRVALPAKSFTWPTSLGYKFAQAGDSFLGYVKSEGMSRQMSDLSNELNDSTSALPMISDKGLSFKGSSSQIFSQGLEGPAVTCNLEMNPDLGGALSLLSTNSSSWGMNEPPDSAPLDHLMLANETSLGQTMMPAEPQSWSLSSSENAPMESRGNLFDLQDNESISFQQFQPFKTPHHSNCFYPGQMN